MRGNISMIVSDLDGTLLNSTKEITPYTEAVLNRCRENRIRTAFATARPKRAAEGFMDRFRPDFVISDNGAVIHDSGGCILSNPIPRDDAWGLLKELATSERIRFISAEAGDRIYTDYNGPSEWGEGWNPVYSDFSGPPNYETTKLSAECDDRRFLEDVLSRYPGLHLYPNSGESWYQIMRKDSTKLNAVLFLCRKLGLDIASVAAFGDDFNDIDMLRGCGVGIAVENAANEARKAADFICGGNDADGVARWIEENVL